VGRGGQYPEAEIAKIPPSTPVYNLTYVDVYAATPQVVYVGYTPGYVGAYPYYGVPVYGTGWYYPPYVGAVYYPHPVTYGVNASYNPYTGWGMGTTVATGFFAFGIGVAIGSSYGRYYGGGGYRSCFNCTINVGGRPGAGGGGRGGRNQVNIGNTAGGGSRQRPANRAGQQPSRNSNLRQQAAESRPYGRSRNPQPGVEPAGRTVAPVAPAACSPIATGMCIAVPTAGGNHARETTGRAIAGAATTARAGGTESTRRASAARVAVAAAEGAAAAGAGANL
jgi:hypothetical protein